ncbi:DNA repair protein [[Actinobacillus] muris]|uniref:DNA repair protein n=1 Tax=Muribacter muris TaxID=67855 RepID=A0A0J5S555_9PAST|nr:DNA repair protein [Muribacter muris]KMK51952.1 DNA repair protein [[Actinobacillus] muris] [Muribacter muris]
MFIQNLNRDQQSVLLYLAKKIAEVDGSSDELQLGMVEILLKQSEEGISEKSISADDLADVFDTERSKCSLVLELLGVAYANEDYHQSERDLVAQYATKLGISDEKLSSLEQWVEKQFALSKEVEMLLS